jgi:hypothetical protein
LLAVLVTVAGTGAGVTFLYSADDSLLPLAVGLLLLLVPAVIAIVLADVHYRTRRAVRSGWRRVT